ncbi:K+/H+ antiporter subunit F [Bartonella apis]|uniref:Multicomponent K+:H+ antiporter subunit F n=1 Tax=Bartonella apis TaxID=1686310 RepID=A0A1R0FBP6_9HYPH|nr:K+/H+ antiporter subunit F [Bartonella apis]MCT6823857.1 K+/H+ antiporter subunit F [Bartonella apis]MCT6887277.1 K+/H+ antiporter subunit F [Bartonella apis]OLY44322.1 multicomponent K+:H+ antiporter subunit F [Bartonella apis]OLY46687.1 multicomponent K+:H+ antiporter subunit F [Bartonella apis]OLY48683.1 multicomponent K+:H+ antiporter subunit F [Bartonella apis]
MSIVILYWGINIAQLFLGLAMILSFIRLIRGPRAQDRILGLDALYTATLMLFVTFGMRTGTTIYFDSALVIGLLGFVSSSALAKFLMRGEVIE